MQIFGINFNIFAATKAKIAILVRLIFKTIELCYIIKN